jgi:hypothetical protein
MRRRYRGGINVLCDKGGKHTLPVDAFDFFIEKSYNTDIDRGRLAYVFSRSFATFKKSSENYRKTTDESQHNRKFS